MFNIKLITITVLLVAVQCQGRPSAGVDKIEHRQIDLDDELIELPFYGGAKGSILKLRKTMDGGFSTEILEAGHMEKDQTVENDDKPENNVFSDNLIKIQGAAQKLVTIQQIVKSTGKITDGDKKDYVENLDILGKAAQALAQMNSGAEEDDFRLLITGDKYKGGNKSKFPNFPPFNSAIKSNSNEGDDDVGEEDEGFSTIVDKENDSVLVNSPSRDASVAEAKPVGLAIAGKGGVASSKPSATAVVGPGGLAIARPSAVAIAGVSPNEVSNLGIPIPQKKIIKKNYGALSRSSPADDAIEENEEKKFGLTTVKTAYGDLKVLVGPDFSPPSVTAKGKVDYSRDGYGGDEEDDEILAEDYQDDVKEGSRMVERKVDEPMAVAPQENIPNRYPLVPPNFTPYNKMMARNNNPKVSLNPMFYPAVPFPAFNYMPFPQKPFPVVYGL